jgi:hypothetical protein
MSSNRVSRELETASGTPAEKPSVIPLWVRVFVVAGGLLMTLGGVIALVKPSMLMSPIDEVTNGVKIYAGYLVARNLALGLFLPLLLVLRARRALASMMVLVGVIQILDVIMDCIEGRWAIVPGVLVLGIVYLIAAARVSDAPFWNRESWS